MGKLSFNSDSYIPTKEERVIMSEQPQFDFKANYFKFLNHEETPLIPNSFVGNKVMGFGAINGPAIEKGNQFGDHMDGFGNRWEYPSTGGGAGVPDVSVIPLTDIDEWREQITIPDPAEFDWKAAYAMECQMIGEPNRDFEAVDFGFGNGCRRPRGNN